MRGIVYLVVVLAVISSVYAAVSVKENPADTVEIKAGTTARAWVDSNGLKVEDE